MKYFKKVESIFYNVEQEININNIFKTCKDGKKVRYSIKDNKIITDITGNIVNWQKIAPFLKKKRGADGGLNIAPLPAYRAAGNRTSPAA